MSTLLHDVLPDRSAPVAARPAALRSDPFEVLWARTVDDVRSAQRLRHACFVGELGARIVVPPGTPPGHDADRLDDYCEHLIVRTLPTAHDEARVIGTYRVLLPEAAGRAGGFYSETEFDLRPLQPLRSRTVELGRSCVHPAWRSGGVILALWAALGELMQRNRLDTMIGCASVSMADGGHAATSLWHRLWQEHRAAPQWHVKPHLALPVNELRHDLDVEPPALIKGYLRCGARLLGAPAWDPDFGVADLPLMMRTVDLPARYRRHFIGE